MLPENSFLKEFENTDIFPISGNERMIMYDQRVNIFICQSYITATTTLKENIFPI